MPSLLSCRSLADSLLQLSFLIASALIQFNLKRFLSFFDCFMPAGVVSGSVDLSRWPSLARWPSTLLARWPIVELANSINILQWHLTKLHSC